MKEHSFFLELGFTPRDSNYKDEADVFRMQFDRFLVDIISISDGVISDEVLKSGEIITPFTLQAEEASAYHTGVKIPTSITKAEKELVGDYLFRNNHTRFEERVFELNNRAMELTRG